MEKKVLFFDIDGTLVAFDVTLPSSARQALLQAKKNGHELVLCTGRSRNQIYPWLLEEIPFDGMVCSSGACIIADSQPIRNHYFPKEDSDFFAAYLRAQQVPFICHVEGGSLCTAEDMTRIKAMYRAAGLDEDALTKAGGNDLFVDDSNPRDHIQKFVYYGCPKTPAQVRADVGDRFNVMAFSFGEMQSTCGEVTQEAFDKDTGIAEYMAYRNRPLSDSIAFGDGPNDERMLRHAGFSVAMGNASPFIQSLADYVTAPLEQDGIAKALEHLGLI